MRKVKKILYMELGILGAAFIAIIVHAIMPSPGATINVEDFDSIIARKLGFPLVASLYFILLYLHILLVIGYFGKRTTRIKNAMAWRYGLAFGFLYLVGMEEVVVEASPFNAYGIDFILFQFVMGLGDAIPTLLLCRFATRLLPEKMESEKACNKQTSKHKLLEVAIIAVLFTVERVIGYCVGYIDSDINRYPAAVMIWTVMFGTILGCGYVLIRPMYGNKNPIVKAAQIAVLSLGLNWMWFNSFMGLLMKGVMGQMVLRSGIDVVVLFIGICMIESRGKQE